ncbi:RIP metalloprotease RseP [Pelagicoccus sp. SDUM812003]|uniref:RIP metalloprotease RseP n=1 Tax=Pelagicoccus sp. SDUM812003 TaxID=3041267 RepID=UPI00280DAA75|nr:RIP metalloprotease RseP [Pelagicoccus sp. SDUM812003]MDQ8201857.1 RIP metalloprotease RseP [Pelagicoccus sp. SDUM812003]
MNFPDLLDKGWGALMVVLFFGGSIFVHELGHFLAAKWRGLHIDRFSIGFGPKIVSWTRGSVEYRLSWFPLGGYVALPQLADMRGIEGDSSVDYKALPRIGYLDKVIVASAGAVFNVIFAFLLASLLFFTGRPTAEDRASTEIGFLSETLVNKDGETVPAPAYSAGLRVGDQIVAIDGEPVLDWDDIQAGIALSSGVTVSGDRVIDFEVLRGDQRLNFAVQPIISEDYKLRQVGMLPGYTVMVKSLFPNSPAVKAGVEPGDVLVALDGNPVRSPAFYRTYISDKKDQEVALTVQRGDEIIETKLVPEEVQVWKNGGTATLTGIYEFDKKRGLIYQTPVEQMVEVVTTTWTNLQALIHKNSDIGISHMSGPAGIIRVIYNASQYDMLNTLWIVVFINVSLAIFNMMPIPVLDGGHIVFATISKLRRNPINPNIIASIQGSFMLLLFSMIIYVSFFDISRWISETTEVNEIRDQRIAPVFGQDDSTTAASGETQDATPEQ